MTTFVMTTIQAHMVRTTPLTTMIAINNGVAAHMLTLSYPRPAKKAIIFSISMLGFPPSKKRHCAETGRLLCVERVKGIEPSSEAWEAPALPLSYTRQ
jgi:hypothetical protein